MTGDPPPPPPSANGCCFPVVIVVNASEESSTTEEHDGGGGGGGGGGEAIPRSTAEKVVIAIALCLIIVVTVGGNLLVCVTVVTTRKLRSTTNFFVVSLAVSDLLLGCLVLPLSASVTVTGGGPTWPLGCVVCNVYVSFDVMLCTASILTLFTISIDRYLSVTRPLHYQKLVSSSRLGRKMIAGVWIFSFLMSFVPIHLGLNTTTGRIQNSADATRCLFELNRPYALLVSVGTYFAPLVVMSSVYVKILTITRRQVKEINGVFLHKKTTNATAATAAAAAAREAKTTASNVAFMELRENSRTVSVANSSFSFSCTGEEPSGGGQQAPSSHHSGVLEERQYSSSRPPGRTQKPLRVVSDRKATVTLASVVLAFAVCWIPYFALFTVKPFLPDPDVISAHLDLLFLWLGYVNSTINPFLYAFYNSSFRQGFKRVLCSVCNNPWR